MVAGKLRQQRLVLFREVLDFKINVTLALKERHEYLIHGLVQKR
jgi:hypothetical protein